MYGKNSVITIDDFSSLPKFRCSINQVDSSQFLRCIV